MENKQHICDLLTETLRATRDQADLKRIRFDYEGGGHRSVNVSLDSGIAMVRDILRALQ